MQSTVHTGLLRSREGHRFEPGFEWPDLVMAVLAGLGSLGLYASMAAPGVLAGDQGELQYMPVALGIPHSTGYPTYVLFGKAWTLLPWSLIPNVSVARSMNLEAAFLGAVTVVLAFVLLLMVVKSRTAALCGASILAVSPTFWSYSLIASPYSLNLVFVLALLILAVRWARVQQDHFFLAIAGLAGIGRLLLLSLSCVRLVDSSRRSWFLQ
jgi:hypothetical protein